MHREHFYKATIKWTGNTGTGTQDYKSYERSHCISIQNKAEILASSDPAFQGDISHHNPEELLVSSLSSCHMLWYLHVCAVNNIIVIAFEDEAAGTMQETVDGSGYFTEVLLRPTVTVTNEYMITKALALHHKANKMCFIANSVNFPVLHEPVIKCLAN